MNKSFPVMIRMIASILIITFFAQDVVWANPEIFVNHQSASTLQIPSFFQNVDAARILEVNLRRLLAYEYTPSNPQHLVLEDRGVRMEVALPPDSKGIISCATIVSGHKSSYKARILPDKSIELIPAQEQLELDFKKPAAPKVFVSPTSLHRPARYIATMLRDITKEDSRVTAAVQALLDMLERNMHSSYMIQEAVGGIRNDISKYGYISARTFQRLSGIVSGVLVNWRKSRKGKDLILGRLARMKARIDGRDMSLIDLDVSLYKQMSIEWPIEKDAMQHIALLLAGIVSGIRISAEKLDEHSRVRPRFDEIASDINAIQKWIKTGGKYPQKDLQNCEEAIRAIVKNISGDGDTRAQILILADKISALRPVLEKIQKNLAIPSKGVWFSLVRVPYEHILLSAAPLEGDDLKTQAESLLSNIDKALAAKYCSRDSIVRQTVFLKNLSDKKKCQAIMSSYYGRAPPPAISYVIQAPASGRLLSIEMTAIPKQSDASLERIDHNIVIVKHDGIRWAYVAGLEPKSGIDDTYEQASDVFGQMERILTDHGFKFENVVRTWIYQGRITGDDGDERQRYDKLNEARYKFFKTGQAGGEIKFGKDFLRRRLKDKVFPYPASTGISMNDGSFVMECLAISTNRKDVEIVPIENPRQTPVYLYGGGVLEGKKINPLFSRGMDVLIGNSHIVFVSGTASIIGDENTGNNIEDQTEGSIENIRLVLKEVGIGLRDIAQLRVYIRDSGDCEKVKNIVEAKFGKTTRLEMIAGVCRKNLLVEIEAVAYSKLPDPAGPADWISQRKILDYYLDPQNDILHEAVEIPEFEERNREIEYAIFKRIVDVYKFRPFRRLEKERKTLLAHFFLPNILPPSEKRKSGIETPKQSESRSEICKKLLFDEILSNRDPGIYRPALGAIIEILAKEKKLHSTYFFDKFYPILEESGKLPRFAEALIDTLISVEHHKEQLFYISDEAEFFDETKHIIRDLASRLPSLRRHIVSYLFAISRKSTVEIPLVRRLLDDLGFYMVSPKEFNQFSALKVAEEIWALQRSRPDRPVVLLLAGGVTMPGFLYELAKMYGINWQRVEIFQHSEYRGKGLGSDYSIANTIEEYLVKEVYAPGDRKHVHYIGADPDPRGYMEELYRLGFGGADILILGVGSNGHIGYNEPGKPSEANGADSLKLVGLSESTVQGIISYNPDIRSDPYAYTMSPAALMKARSIFLFANGSRKAQIVKDAFANPLMPEVPVSEILEHRDVSVVLDSEAVKELTENAFDEYVKTEYALRESKDRLNVLINGNLPPSHEIDREGTIKWISQEEADMLGYNPAQMIGRPIWEFVAPEEQEISQNAIAKKVSFQQELPPFERKYKRSDGTYIWVYIEEIQIVNNAGKVTGILSNMANINEAKLKHEELEAQAHDLLESLGSPDQNGGSSKLLSIHPIAILFAVLFPAVILIIAAIVIYIKVKRSRIARLAHIKSFNAFIQGRDDKTGREWVEHGGMRLGIREIAGYIDKREAMGATLFANVSDTLRQKIAGRLTKDGAQYLAEICRKLQIELAGQSDNIRDEHLKNNSLFVRLYKGAAIGVGPTLAESDFLCIVEAVPQEKNVSDKHVIIRIIDQKTEKEITSLDLEYGVTCEISREGVEGFKGNKIYHLPVPSVKALSGSKHLSIRVVERDGEDWIRIADLGSTNGTNVTLNTYRYHVKPVEVVQKPVLPETGKASGGAFTGTKRKIIRIKSAVPAKLPSGPGSKPTLAVLPFYDIYSLAAAAIIFALVFLLEKPVSCIIKRMNLMRSLKDPHWYSRIDITRQFAKDYPGDVMSVLRTLFRNERDNRVREAILNLMGNYGSRADLWAVDFMEEVAYSRDASDAIASVAAIGAIGGNYAAKRLILIDIRLKRESLFDTDAKRDLVRQSVMQALGKTGSFIAMNYLSSIINKKDLAARHAVLALGYPVYKDAVPLLRECVKSDDFRIRRNAQEALDNIGPVFAVVPIKVQDHDGPEILESIESIKAIKKSCSTAFVIGVYHREDMKTIPKSHESPLGEDALRKMVDQLQSLHKINPLFNWKLILACSVGLGVGSAHHTERAWKNIQDSYKTAGDPLDSSQVEILRIGMMEDGNINSKKSGAILFGMHEALSGRFDYIGYAEMGAIDLRQAGLLIGSLEKGEAEVAIGSRWMKGSSMKNMPLSGTIISKICNWFTRFILPPLRDIKDPQTEFKIFKKDCLVRILPLARDGSIAFNAELLLLAQLEGYKIKEVPVHWVFSKESESERMFLRYLINLNLLSDFNRLSEGLKMISGLLRYRKYLKESYWNKSAPTDYNGTGTAMLKGFAPFKNMYTSLNRYCAALFAAPALEAVFVIPGVFAHPYAPLLLGIAMAVFVSLHIFNINRQEFARAPPLEKAKILFKTFFAPLLLAALTFYIRYSQGITGIDLIMYNFSLHLVINYFALKTDGKIFHVATAGQSVAGGLTAAATPVKNTDTWRMKIAERLLTVFMRLKLRQTLKPIPADIDELPPVIAGRSYYLYIHIPFCESLCPYCSFHRQLYDPGTTKQYFENLRREMRMAAKRGYKFSSLYIGGGTPTVDVDELIKTIDLARELFDVKEVSCETHAKHLLPTVVGRLAGKVDRISVGVQSLNDDILARMKRYEQSYSGADVIRRIADMQGMFRTMNVDMIYNLPGQTVEMLEDDIRRIIASGAEQITFYPLMTSPVVRASLSEAMGQISYRNEVAYYAIIVRRLKEAGFEASSPWCFSRNKSLQIDEYIARSPEYVGLGSGAFSYLNGNLYVNTFSLEEYADRIAAGKAPITGTRRFSSKEQMRYRFMMDLFNLGLDTKRFAEDFGVSVARGLWMEMAFMRAAGAFGKNEGNIITLTKAGRYFMVVMMREFFSGINNLRDQARQHIRQPVPAQPVALITPTIEGYRGMSTKDVTVRVSHGKIDAKTSLMVDELPYVEWDSRAREQITNFLRYYRGIIRDIRLYKSGNNFRVLFVMEDNSGHRRGFIRNPKIFNQNLIVHLSKILKYLSRNIGSTEDKRELLARSQMALFWTILGVLSERASGIYERFFNNTADEYIKELEGPSARIPEEYNRDSFFKDYIGGYSRVYALEIERIEQFLSETKKDGKELEVNIYDLGPWAGLFAPVAAARLDAWAKRNSVLLKATFYIVDPDLNAFEKLGEVRYKKFTKLYKAEAGKNSGLVFEYNTPKTDESLGGGYAQNVVYRPGSIVLANDFYEHIEGFEGQILSRMAGQNSIGLQFVHVPYEAKPDTSWGHVNSFNSANLKSSFGRFFGPGYDLEVIDDPEGKGGFLTIRANALIHETYPLRFLEQCSYIRRVLPSIIASKDRKNGLPITIRIFSLRCSSGEEIASVSATINHELSKHPEWGLTYGRDIVLDITGVDQSQDILDQATAKLTGGFDANEYHKTYPETLWPTLHRQTDFVNKWMPSGLIKHTTFVRSDISDEDVLLRAAQADIVLMNTALIYNTKEKVQGVLGTLSKNMTDRTFILTDFLTICAHLVTFVELRELFTVTPLSGDGQTSILLSKKQSPVHPVSAMPSTADAGTGLAPAPETTAPMTALIAGGDKEGQYGSHLIGKVFRKNREALELVTENIVGQTEEAPDGGRTLVLCESIDRDVLGPLYTKDGEEARVKLTGKMILSHSGKAIYIFEDHKYIKGFSARGEAYLAKSLEDNRMAVFHEATESNMIELSKSLLTKIHPHTLLRLRQRYKTTYRCSRQERRS
ncbi:MAG: coproporphyrinogen III oxidase family protein [Candidatus Omnitrophica bacterium]|nr:coproporphyrinogen III oxidase family protein [Candidatus Omnitrophota bacterium]